ncbi:MAG: signal peptidase I [Thermodesulfobacteriota bacterium]
MGRAFSNKPWLCRTPDDSESPERDTAELFEELLGAGTSVRVRVTGRSMSPFLQGDEFVTVRREPVKKMRRGDLVLFRDARGFLVLHRLMGKKRSGNRSFFTTKGDAVDLADEPVAEERVLGRVCAVEPADGGGERDLASLRFRLINRALYLLHRMPVVPGILRLIRRLYSESGNGGQGGERP